MLVSGSGVRLRLQIVNKWAQHGEIVVGRYQGGHIR